MGRRRSYYRGYRRYRSYGPSKFALYEKLDKAKKSLSRTRKKQKEAREAITAGLGGRGTEASKNYWGTDWAHANEFSKKVRKGLNFYGNGDYKSVLAKVSRGIGGIAGGALGLMHGGVHGGIDGAQSGWDSGANFSKWAGWGDYGPMVTNQIMDGGSGDQQLVAVNPGDMSGDLIFSHTEFVQNVTVNASGAGTSKFSLQSFPINPGLSNTFPFLAQIAANFTLYELQGLIFQYKPTSGEFGSTNSNSLGKVIMATNYDPDADNFANSQQMENYDYASASKPSIGALHGIETAPKQRLTNQLYIRTGVSTKDKILTDIGNFQVATEGIYCGASGQFVIGELWVTYRIKLSRANLNLSSSGSVILDDRFSWVGSTSAFLDSDLNIATTNNLGCTVSNVSTTKAKILFPSDITATAFLITFVIQATSNMATQVPSFTDVTNGTLKGVDGFAEDIAPSVPGSTNKQLMASAVYKPDLTGPGPYSVNICVADTIPNNTGVKVFITQVDNNWGDTF